MSFSNGTLGNQPYVEIDGVPFPLVAGSMIQRSPLNPFSPTNQAGNSARITDARLAVEVWDDFTGGLGQRDNEGQATTSYAEGNLDARVPGAVALPPAKTLLGTLGITQAPAYVCHMRNATTYALLVYSPKQIGYSRYQASNGTIVTNLGVGNITGFAAFKGQHYFVEYTAGTTVSRLFRTTDLGASFPLAHTSAAGVEYRGLVNYDNRLWTVNQATGQLLVSSDGATWGNIGFPLAFNPGERISELFVWASPSGSDLLLYAITNQRILAFNEVAGEWNAFYSFEGVVQASYPRAHTYRRDSNLYVTFMDDPASTLRDRNSLVLTFTPDTSDEVGPGKRYGLPVELIDGITHVEGGIHWLYAFANGTPGGVFAFNEFGGWTNLIDPALLGTGDAILVGGGYANGRLWALLSTGQLYEAIVPDRRTLPPGPDANAYAFGEHYIRSSWTTHNQFNRVKLGSHFEIDMRQRDGTSGVPIGTEVKFRYRYDNTDWTEITLGGAGENEPVGLMLMQSVKGGNETWPATVVLPENTDQFGIPYRRIQWEVAYARTTASTPVLASVSLYYTYWQESHFSYQFNIDLTWQTWSEWEGKNFAGYSREELEVILMSMTNQKNYHTFLYAPGAGEVFIEATDLLVASREDADHGGGIYSVTVRDLTANRSRV